MATDSRTLVVLALITNGIIAVVDFVAAGASGSTAMEQLHRVGVV